MMTRIPLGAAPFIMPASEGGVRPHPLPCRSAPTTCRTRNNAVTLSTHDDGQRTEARRGDALPPRREQPEGARLRPGAGAGASGGPAGAVEIAEAELAANKAGFHLMGDGAPWATTPATSVTDFWGRCHDVPNLWIVDGSLFS